MQFEKYESVVMSQLVMLRLDVSRRNAIPHVPNRGD